MNLPSIHDYFVFCALFSKGSFGVKVCFFSWNLGGAGLFLANRWATIDGANQLSPCIHHQGMTWHSEKRQCEVLMEKTHRTGWWQLKYFYFQPYLGKIPIFTNIFQMGWNHQLEKGSMFFFFFFFFFVVVTSSCCSSRRLFLLSCSCSSL